MSKSSHIPITMLNILMTHPYYLSTRELVSQIGCHRHSIREAANVLECSGFHIDIKKDKAEDGWQTTNYYRFVSVCGGDE